MALARTQREWAILVGEYNICKKKLESKREALRIMKREWQLSQDENEVYKNKLNQLQKELDQYIKDDQNIKQEKQCDGKSQQESLSSPDIVSNHTSKDTLAQFLFEYKQANKALKHDFEELKRLYIESQEDVQLMRNRMRRQSSSSNYGYDENNVNDGKENYIMQLEEYKEQVAKLELDVKSMKDENSDLISERDYYREKFERLNTQLNYILSADDRRLVDIDALVLDNKYLKEKLTLLEEERNLKKESIKKYEDAFEKKKNKLLQKGTIARLSLHYSKLASNEHSMKTVEDLRNVANILSETITEKNLAISHQRNANRILGRRVCELENKLKTLEVAGLWSLPGHRGYGSLNLSDNDLHLKDSPMAVGSEPMSPRLYRTSDTSDETSRKNVMLVKPNDDPFEINGNCLKQRAEHCKYSPSNSRVSTGDSASPEFRSDSKIASPDLRCDERYSSPDPSSSFLNRSPIMGRKLSRVSSAPCLTGNFT